MPQEIIRDDEILNMNLAEMNLAEQITNILLTINQEGKMAQELISGFIQGKMELVKKGYEPIKKIKDDAQRMKESTMEYVVRVSPTLMTKELYMFSLSHLDRISQIIDSIIYRLSILAHSGFTLDQSIAELFSQFSSTSFNMVELLYTESKYLSSNSKKVGEIHDEINRKEDLVDQLYRRLELEIIRKYSNDLFHLLLLKEVVDLIEELSDKIRDASHDFRYISLYKA
ncbi:MULTISPECIES: DUF47 domain-containing protein [Fervidicoccus]|jgi:uncharacterized protein Yka (UPF0111/DUF47 family)|uniref:DUF47 domain-containing protein n=2 Tax=Fervidicoccus fontis TaxID=683846 RepID=A0A2J6N5T6_9CREN|nr:DUF47 family protein [Fervidicoccus fontis]AFH42762.1 putative phosphate transport regulator [Fervidicoccus fontis Kam940]PMB75409.1 MAG: DUF47 domain-containing protein [Fervidicoccus fontis]PMB76685.1 MAG: DUF47 domain-containing protein [Fervidicoccus fontis]HEW64000.1 DUF47 family protein [Fervidicoccus fontis]